MKIEQLTVFICEHCNRKMFGKGAMSRHEKYCKENPNNKHKCFEFCKHLKMEKNYTHDEWGNNYGGIEFTCMKTGDEMYSYKFEKNTSKPVGILDTLKRMPLECDLYEDINTHVDIDYDSIEFMKF